MNNISANDPNFINSQKYKDFLKENPGQGILNIRVYTASQAVPISNLKIVVTKKIGNNNVIFFEGYSDSSGIIPPISLPAPKLNQDDLKIPESTTYDVLATYMPDNVSEDFKIEMYDGVSVVQNINVALTNVEGY